MKLARAGFTLIEAVTTMTIVAVLVAISAPIVASSVDGYAAAATRGELAVAQSAALERIACEVRDIPLRSGVSTAAPAIESVGPGSITWSTNSSLSQVGTTLRLTLGGSTPRTLLTDVESFAIQAFDEDNASLGGSLSGDSCDAIRRLSFTVTTARGGVSETMRTRCFLRCTMSGAAP